MKIFFGEFVANYNKYHFPYQVWLLKEEGDLADSIYACGFLPLRYLKNVFYLSRSLRVYLDLFNLSSENKRILNKTTAIEADLTALPDFNYIPQVQKMCKDYAQRKIGESVFSSQGIKNIFTNGPYNYVFVFRNVSDQEEIGYAVCFISNQIVQYAHSFYKVDYIGQNLGARMILEAVNWAKKNQKKYIYLGTCYSKEALYKTEFKGIEFFNGFMWNSNLLELKKLVSGFDEEEYLLKNKKYLEEFYENNLDRILSNYGVRVSL